MAEESQSINLKILSPSTEVESGVNLQDLPASTTIKELRARIQDAVPSKPATERMRLIYRGRVVTNDADTLSHVFGAESLRESKDQSLHLVLRELPTSNTSASPMPRSSNASPNPLQPAQAPANPLQTNPFRPNSQPRLPPVHHHNHNPHHIPVPANTFPLPLPPQLQQHFAQTMAQPGQQNNGQPPNPGGDQAGGDTPVPAPAPENNARAPIPGLALPPMGLPNLPGGNIGQPIRQEGVGPNGARWTVSFNQVNIPVRPQQTAMALPPTHNLGLAFPPFHPGLAPVADPDSRHASMARIRLLVTEARRMLENVRVLHQTRNNPGTSNSPPNVAVWRLEQIRLLLNTVLQHLDAIDRGLAVLTTDALMGLNMEFLSLRRSATDLRYDALEVKQMLDREQGLATSDQAQTSTLRTSTTEAPTRGGTSTTIPGAPIMTPAVPTTSQPQTQNTTQAMPTDAPAELFLLSSPQGPVGILFDQQGTYTMAPMAPTLPLQTYTTQFAQNRQLLASLGQQITQGSNQAAYQLANIQPTPTQQPAAGAQAQDHNQGRDQLQNQNQNQNQNADRNANPPAENDRMVNIAGHLWLIFKLAAFVYFFAGGGGFYRPIMLSIMACIVYLAQIGIFEEHINLARRHFEALLPAAVAQANDNNRNNARADANRNITPEEAARRILERQRGDGWVRESMRTVERAFALFVASLFPGVGERMVHAQEERQRLERVAAEEERQRQEDEARRREEEAQRQHEAEEEKEKEKKKHEPSVEEESGKASASASVKGKERADLPESEATASSQS